MSDLDEVVREVVALDQVESAAIFVVGPGGTELDLGAAAGIEGPALDGLVAAVRNADHPIRRSVHDSGPTWDVRPMNPGGPALRSHLPLRSGEGTGATGVLAVAHDEPLTPRVRARLERASATAARTIQQLNQEETR